MDNIFGLFFSNTKLYYAFFAFLTILILESLLTFKFDNKGIVYIFLFLPNDLLGKLLYIRAISYLLL
jgi:hypothetical protein